MNLRALLAQSSSPIIIGHQNADPDAVCSMLAASSLYLSINPEGNPTLVCEDVSKLSNQVLETLESTTEIHEFSEKSHDLTILLDTNSRFQLGPRVVNLLGDPSRTLVIDHHEENPDIQTIAQYTLIKTNASSTCEIVFELFEELNVELDTVTANLLLTGILFDSRRFLLLW